MKRLIEIHGVFAIALFSALALRCSEAVEADDWPLVRGGPLATGLSEDSLKAPLETVWTYSSEKGDIEATASIVGGVVYVGDIEGTFHALDLATGKEIWKREFPDTGFVSGTAVVGGSVYCVDYNGILYKLSAADGAEQWRYESDSSLYAAPNVVDSHVLLVTEAGELLSLDAADAKLQWKFAIDQPLRCWPTTVDGQIFVAGCDGKLHVIDMNSGAETGSIDIGGPADSIPAVQGGRVFFCTAGGVFHAMTIKPLAEVWKYGHRGQGEEIHGAAVCDRAVVVGTHDKRLVALDPATGKELWEFRLRSRAQSSPVIVGDLAIAATIRGRLHAVELSSGKEAWHADMGGKFVASPAVSDGRIVLGNAEDATIYCLASSKSKNTDHEDMNEK
jgi:outer membrane protein assembly factor BamB